MDRRFIRNLFYVSVPRRGFVVFLPLAMIMGELRQINEFQSPEGDSLFFYEDCEARDRRDRERVSVPRRGFVVFLL